MAGSAQDNGHAEITAGVNQSTPSAAADSGLARQNALDELDWMIGSWVDKGEDATIDTTCAWALNRKYITRTFRVTMDGKVALEGTQTIGWDPIQQQIRSWTFDSEGGFGEGHWIKDDNRWLVKTSFALANEDRASALNVFTYFDDNTLRWQSIDREIAGEIQPSIPEVTVIRQTPKDDATNERTKVSR
jgi:hypothetical protein